MKKSLLMGLSAAIVLSGTCFAGTAVSVIKLEKVKPVETFFTGKAEAVDNHTLSFGANEGRINWTLRPGDIFEGPIFNADGTIAKEGTLIAEMDNDDQYGQVESAKLAVKVAEKELELAKSEYDRNVKSKKAISQAVLEKSEIAYLEAKLKLEDAKGALKGKEYFLYRTKMFAPYTGIIVEVMRGTGMGTGKGDDVLRIEKMSPMLIKVPFATEIVNLVMSQEQPVFVYTPYKDQPEVAWFEQNPLDKNTLFVYAGNSLTATSSISPEDQNLPKVYGFFPVSHFYEKSVVANLGLKIGESPNPNLLGAPKIAIRHDNKGDYVLRVVGAKAMSDKSFPAKFQVERVDVKAGKIYRDIDLGQYTSVQLFSFDDAGTLSYDDVLVLYSDDALKAGDTAVYAAPHWIFNPGDTVKVKIPGITPEGLYVPQGAVIHQAEASNYVYIVQNGKAKLVEVNLVGRAGENYAITGDGISEGVQVIVPDDKKAASALYDGIAVDVKSTISTDPKLTNPSVEPLVPIDQLTFF